MKDEIVIYEEELSDVSSLLNNSGEDVSSTCENINPSFNGAVSVGLLGNSVGTISNQMGNICKSIDNVKTAIDEFSEDFMTYDKEMAIKINDIDIPNDFLASDSSVVNTYSEVLLQKFDGESVNDGRDASSDFTLNESSINKSSLGDISSSSLTVQSFDDTSSISTLESLSDINKSLSVNTISYDDRSELEQNFMLIDMINRDDTISSTYDDTSSVNEVDLYDINRGYEYAPDTQLDDREDLIITQ